MIAVVCRIAVSEVEAHAGDVAGNVAEVAHLIEEAARGGADLALFPEAVITGYDSEVFSRPLPDLDDQSWLEPLQAAVDRTGTTAVVNSALQQGRHRSLTDVLLTPGQEPLAAYAKQHLYDAERPVFTPGREGFTFVVGGLVVALSVCYDANFPEHAAAAARAGAHVYANSGAYFPGGAHRRDLHYAARALDNGIYVAFSGLVGSTHDFIGGSAVFDPLGRRMASVGAGEHLAFADLDVEVIAEVRANQRMWAQRRDDLGPYRRHEDMDGLLFGA